ncbi:hypothetical protein FGADI_1551 [Fusarium gaditjirri]|uniref:Uncharacterized protein n=1 Tax=Fusarium gaditjirri TaxID=282569 RepID=A0A8H4X2I5_9HYPO|nr:hypothetical protein FGADI_1551 [Fusarium gaditjirri]
MSPTQNVGEDPIHGAPTTSLRGILRGMSVHSGNVANQCREWVYDCKKTMQSLEDALRLIINKKDAQAAITEACRHPTSDNVHLAMKEINDADKCIRALQGQIGGYVNALQQWLDEEPGF